MRDVLGTIAADQDAIIRAGSRGALVVDGGPGTGKTVVALHRTAYLLYADPRLGHRRGGVLFVGPHQPYLAYVSDVLPSLGEDTPFFHPRHEPIWDVLEELEMPVNTHTAISAVTDHMATGTLKSVPHPACAAPIMTAQAFFFTQQIMTHMIWGGVFERHPRLQMAMTEQGSGWVISALRGMDYSWERSYLRRDVREVVKRKPSEYFARQIHMGSSLFSRAEAEARHDIGVGKINIGMDYPHHEGTWGAGPGTTDWLRATLGAAGVPVDEARAMLGGNATALWGFDPAVLRTTADRIGSELGTVLTPPTAEHFPRGDVNKPLATAF